MKRSRWVSLVVCVLLSVVLVSPVSSGTNLVVNGDFSQALGSEWSPAPGSSAAVLSDARSPGDDALTSDGTAAISYVQCVNLPAALGPIDVGGAVWFSDWETGYILVEIFYEPDCGDDVKDSITLTLASEDDVSQWRELRESDYALPASDCSALITLHGPGQEGGVGTAYFDDIFLEESAATRVRLVAPSGRAPMNAGVGAGIVGLAAASLVLHRRRGSSIA